MVNQARGPESRAHGAGRKSKSPDPEIRHTSTLQQRRGSVIIVPSYDKSAPFTTSQSSQRPSASVRARTARALINDIQPQLRRCGPPRDAHTKGSAC
jgi:hypothetical protein